MSTHNISHANHTYLGRAYSPARTARGAKLSPVSVWDYGVIATGTDVDVATGIIPINVKADLSIVMPVSRTIKLKSSAAGDTMVATIVGANAAGYVVTEDVTLTGTTAVETTKCFKSIILIKFASAPAGTFSIGSGDKIQFNQAVSKKWQVLSIHADDVVDSATITVSDATDNMGYFELATAPAGRSVVVIQITEKTDTLSVFGSAV